MCTGYNNEIYKTNQDLSCTKVYTDRSNKIIIYLKDNDVYMEYTSESTNTITSISEFIIYECIAIANVQSGCTTLAKDYYIDTTNNHIYAFNPSNGTFSQLIDDYYYDNEQSKYYICISGECHEAGIGFYLAGNENPSGTFDNLIKCSNTICSVASAPTVDGYYINGDDDSKSLIKCINADTTPACSVSVSSSDIKNAPGYAYLDARNEDSTNTMYGGVIICTTNSCSPKLKPSNSNVNRYYIDADKAGDSDIIICNNSKCESTSGTTTKGYTYIDDTTIGYVLFGDDTKLVSTPVSATTNSDKHFIDASDPKKIITCFYNTASQIVACSSSSSGATETKTTYYIDDGITDTVNIIECVSNSNCVSKPAQAGYYINESANYPLIFCSENNSQMAYELIPNTNINIGYYLDGSSTNDNTDYNNIIYCSSRTSCSILTTTVNGYYLDESSTNDNSIYTKLINYENSKYSSVTTNQVGCYLDGSSSPDNTNYNKAIYCSTATSCSLISSTIKGYYLDASSTSDDIKYNSLLVCNGSSYSLLQSFNTGYYLNGNSSTDSRTYSSTITCTSGSSCSLNSNNFNGYYFDGDSTSDNMNYSKLILYDGTNYSTVSTINIGFYLDDTKSTDNTNYTGVISCTDATTCTEYSSTYKGYYLDGSSKVSNAYSKLMHYDGSNFTLLSRTNIGYYLDGNSTSDDTSYCNIIYCNSETSCLKITTTIEGFYLDPSTATTAVSRKRAPSKTQNNTYYSGLIIYEGSDYKIFDSPIQIGYYLNGGSSTDSTNYSKVIYCSSSTSCLSITTAINGFYVDATSTTDNEKYKKLISCDGSIYTSISTLQVGYYLNGSSSLDSLNYINLIDCIEDTNIVCSVKKKNNISKGFYFEGSTVIVSSTNIIYVKLFSCKMNSNNLCKMHDNT